MSKEGLNEWAEGKFSIGGRYTGELHGNTDWALARKVWSAAIESKKDQIKYCNDEIMIDVYEYLADIIQPHIGWNVHGLSSCDESSLTASVTESFEYLLEFWLKNRDKEGIEHP